MIYDDGTGRRIYRPLRGTRPPSEMVSEPSEAVREAVRQVAAANPGWGPEEVYAEIRRTRHDISRDVVIAVMTGLQRTRQDRNRLQ